MEGQGEPGQVLYRLGLPHRQLFAVQFTDAGHQRQVVISAPLLLIAGKARAFARLQPGMDIRAAVFVQDLNFWINEIEPVAKPGRSP